MFWSKDKTEKKFSQLHNLLAQSFRNVKNDTNLIFQWLNYFYKKTIEQDNLIRQLRMELSYMPRSREDIKRIIDEYYSYEPIMKKIRELDEKIELIKSHKTAPLAPKQPYELAEIRSRLEKLEQKKASVKEKIIKRLTKNSKEYIKAIILSYIKKYGKISAMQLKEMVVEEQGLCSKSSFYRILEEIEGMEDIASLRKGKEKYYMAKKIRLQ
jgi:tetrahydromethanopterin S-methyltransferase subunit G